MPSQAKSFHLPNLNGIRFVAALLVFLGHVEWMKKISNVPNYSTSTFEQNTGLLGVNLFFVLSGFLITYLLLAEKRQTGSISAQKFYLRRILRILPLYLVTVFMAFFVFPHFIGLPGWEVGLGKAAFAKRLLLFLGMLPNVAYVVYPLVPFASQLWTVGVEEQFYLIWPHICRCSERKLPWVLIGIILAVLGARASLIIWNPNNPKIVWNEVSTFLQCFRIQCMALGGIAAHIANSRAACLFKLLSRRSVEWVALAVAGWIQICGLQGLRIVEGDLCAACFAVIILNASVNPDSIFLLEWGPLPYLGRISYGLYVWQIVSIRLCFVWLANRGLINVGFHRMVSLYVMSAALTVVLSALSYRLLELPFLRLRERVSVVPSYS